MQEISLISFSGIFALRDGVSEDEFLPRLHAFFQHFIDIGFATGYRIMRRQALEGFGKTLPPFTYRGELVYPDLEREQAAYEYVKQRGEQVRAARCNELAGQPLGRLLPGNAHRIIVHVRTWPTGEVGRSPLLSRHRC